MIKPLQLVEGRFVDNRTRRESEINTEQNQDGRNLEKAERFVEEMTNEYGERNKRLEIKNGEQKGNEKEKQQETREQSRKGE